MYDDEFFRRIFSTNIFLTNFFDELFWQNYGRSFWWILYLLTIASFRMGVPSILFCCVNENLTTFYTLWIGGTRKQFFRREKKFSCITKTTTTKNWFLVFSFSFWFQFIQLLEDLYNKVALLTVGKDFFTYRLVTSSRPVYYSKVKGQRLQYISIKFLLHKESENPWTCY